jgi:hypothetical protein
MGSTRLSGVPHRDKTSEALITLTQAHHQAHEGAAYSLTATGTQTLNVCFKVPAGSVQVHMLYRWTSGDATVFTITENRTWTTNTGTATTVFNRNRRSTNISVVQEDKSDTPNFTAGAVVVDATLVGDGTAILVDQSFAAGASRVGNSRADDEFVLKSDETYVFDMAAGVGDELYLQLSWYETISNG